jgi:hypothetical protein
MPPVIIQGGIILNPDDTDAQQLQAHAQDRGLDHIHVFHATLAGKGHTYFVLNRSHPVFQDTSPDLERRSALARSEGKAPNRRKACDHRRFNHICNFITLKLHILWYTEAIFLQIVSQANNELADCTLWEESMAPYYMQMDTQSEYAEGDEMWHVFEQGRRNEFDEPYCVAPFQFFSEAQRIVNEHNAAELSQHGSVEPVAEARADRSGLTNAEQW